MNDNETPKPEQTDNEKLFEILTAANEQVSRISKCLNDAGIKPSTAATLGMLKLAIDTTIDNSIATRDAFISMAKIIWGLSEIQKAIPVDIETVEPVPGKM